MYYRAHKKLTAHSLITLRGFSDIITYIYVSRFVEFAMRLFRSVMNLIKERERERAREREKGRERGSEEEREIEIERERECV